MNITIIGAGAMGMLFYSQLQQQHNVSFYEARIGQCHLNDIAVSNISGLSTQLNTNYINASQISSADCILVCLKSYQILSALRGLPNLSLKTDIVLMHNGMGVKEEIEQTLKINNPIYTLLTTQASKKLNKYHALHTGIGANQLGVVKRINTTTDSSMSPKSTDAFVDIFTRTLSNTTYSDSLAEIQWKKLAVNCAINPLTAIHDVPNGALSCESYNKAIKSVTLEVIEMAKQEGVNLDYDEIIALVYQVINNTTKNSSSMREDVRNKRKTEMFYICGYVQRLGQKYNYPTPVNNQLLKKIQAIENHYLA